MNTLLVPIILIVLSGLSWAFIIHPNKVRIDKKSEIITEIEDLVLKANQIIEKRDELQNTANTISSVQKQFLEDSIPRYSEENLAKFFISLDALLKSTGIAFEHINVKITNSPNNLSSTANNEVIGVDIALTGVTYDEINIVFQRLSNWTKSIIVSSVDVNKQQNRSISQPNSKQLLNIVISFDALFSKQLILTNI